MNKFRAMSNKTRYLSLLVMLTFTLGQVQYACSSYFCTMTHKTYSLTSCGASSSDESCGATMVTSPSRGPQFADAGCMQIRLAEKKVIDNFSAPDKAPSHVVSIVAILPAGLFSIRPAASVTVANLPFASSPPIYLP